MRPDFKGLKISRIQDAYDVVPAALVEKILRRQTCNYEHFVQTAIRCKDCAQPIVL